MNIIIKPTPVKTLKPGDLFRDDGQTFQIADIVQNDDVVEIVYYTGTSTFINSFFLAPDDTLDKIIDKGPSSPRRRASKPRPMNSSTSTTLSTPSSGSPPTVESIRFNRTSN